MRFKGRIIYWRGPAPFYFIEIPQKQSDEIKSVSKQITYGWGVIPVTAQVRRGEWSTSLFPKDGLYLLPLKKVVRESLKVDTGDFLEVKLELGR
jgi:hypothetical protein